MTTRRSPLRSLITTKLIIGVTGILLFAYLILHIAGNLMVFLGRDAFNSYSHALISNPLVVPVEIGLLVVFLIHLFKAIRMTFLTYFFCQEFQGCIRQPEFDKPRWQFLHEGLKSILRPHIFFNYFKAYGADLFETLTVFVEHFNERKKIRAEGKSPVDWIAGHSGELHIWQNELKLFIQLAN